MNPSIQSWASLPDRIKQQAAPEMLAGAVWSYFGRPVERPRDSELTRWIPPPVCPARRTNAEKRSDVLAALKVMPRASLRAVAKQTGTSHQFVANVRGASRQKNGHPRSKMASSGSLPTLNQATNVQGNDSICAGVFNQSAAIGGETSWSSVLKEQLSTGDGKALLPIVASYCGDSAPTNANDQQRMDAMRNESDSSRIVAVDANEIGQRNCKTLPD